MLAVMAVGRGQATFHRAAREILDAVGEWGGWHAATVYLATAGRERGARLHRRVVCVGRDLDAAAGACGRRCLL